MMMVMLMVVVLLFGAVYRIQYRMCPFRRVQVPPELTYEYWRERQQKPPDK